MRGREGGKEEGEKRMKNEDEVMRVRKEESERMTIKKKGDKDRRCKNN